MVYYATHWIIIITCDFICVKILNIDRGIQYRHIMIFTCIVLLPVFSFFLIDIVANGLANKNIKLL